MKDHFVNDGAFATEFNDDALHLDDPKSSTVMRCKTVGRLVVGLQHKLAFCIQRYAMVSSGALENTDAPQRFRRVTVALVPS